MLTLKQLRLKHNIKQIIIAKHLNISDSHYSRIETGNKRITYEIASDIAKYYNLEINQIKWPTTWR